MAETLQVLLQEAISAADDFGSPVIGTEHLLLSALGHEDDPAIRLLAAWGITEETVRDRFSEIIREVGPPGFSPRDADARSKERIMLFTDGAGRVVRQLRTLSQRRPVQATDVLVAIMVERGTGCSLISDLASRHGATVADREELEGRILALGESS